MGGPALIASLAIALCAQHAAADFDCREAPDNDMETTCKMIQEWDSNARKAISRRQAFQQANPVGAPGVPGNPGLSPMVPQQFPSQPQDCMSIACICTHMGGRSNGNTCTLRNGQQMGMAIRKEYRMMSMPEKMRFHNAVLALKRSGEYDRISIMHRQVGSSSGAHSGPGFLPWHREYMKRIEIALRMVDPGVALPYWDSTLDNHLPDPRDSIMFSHMFMGEMDASGQVVKGAFAGFRTLEGRPNIIRRLGSEGKLFREENINSLLAQNQIQNVLAYTAPQNGCPFRPNFAAIEYTHSSVHLWVGGDMKPPTTSANDPIFFLHHCFVDFLWEMWRQLRQNRFARESAYPPDIGTCANQQHFSYANMRPWAKQNKDGLSNVYTDQLFRYQPRPTCSRQNPNCGSAYLFCDTRGAPHCVAKVKENGLCRGFEGFDVCFMGTCQAGWCRPGGGGAAAAPQTTALAVAPQGSSQAWSPVPQTAQTTAAPAAPAAAAGNCFNDDPCCDAWARTGECTSNRNYMQRYCKRSCRFCASNDNRQGCVDRHQSCAYWRTQNYCTRRRQWMAENCQAACGWCNLGPQQLCQSTARMFAA